MSTGEFATVAASPVAVCLALACADARVVTAFMRLATAAPTDDTIPGNLVTVPKKIVSLKSPGIQPVAESVRSAT